MYNEQFEQKGNHYSDDDGALEFLKRMTSKDDMRTWRHTVY